MRFAVRVQPRSNRSGVDGVHGDALRVRVNAAPVEGAANEEVIAVIAAALGVGRRSVSIVSGFGARNKVVEAVGVELAAVVALAGDATG